MSHPNNKRPNDQQRLSQDFLAKQTQSTDEFVKQQVTQDKSKPIASVQRNELI